MLGTSEIGINFAIETATSILLIISIYLAVAMTFYISTKSHASSLLAVIMAVYVDRVGTLLARLAVFAWRRFGTGEFGGEMSLNEREVLLIGTVLSIIGTIWLIRILLRQKLGEWPWIVSVAISVLFMIFAGWRRWA